jgi:hypothetical protein
MDADLAALYGVETKALRRAVKRNLTRFPADFMFVITPQEVAVLRCQFGTLRWGEHPKYLPMAFTEQGVSVVERLRRSRAESEPFMTKFLRNHPEARPTPAVESAAHVAESRAMYGKQRRPLKPR